MRCDCPDDSPGCSSFFCQGVERKRKRWEGREEHPKATLQEREQARDERLSRVHRAIGKAQAATPQWSAPTVEGRCAHEASNIAVCRAAGEARSPGSVPVPGVPPVGTAVFPLDRERTRETSGRTPQAHECLVRPGAWMPFAHAAEPWEAMPRGQVRRSTVRRVTEAAGKRCEQQHEPEGEGTEQGQTSRERESAPMAMSADGAMVSVRGKGWHEGQTLVRAEVELLPTPVQPRLREKRTSAPPTFSRLSDADTVSEPCRGEISRRGIDRAERVGAIQDGALWFQGVVDEHRHDAVRLLDGFHAAQSVPEIGVAIRRRGGHLPLPGLMASCIDANTTAPLACSSTWVGWSSALERRQRFNATGTLGAKTRRQCQTHRLRLPDGRVDRGWWNGPTNVCCKLARKGQAGNGWLPMATPYARCEP